MGGMGPAATVDFLRRLVDATLARTDQDHLRVLVDSDPRVPDRTAFLLGTGPDPRPALIKMARGLERNGADLLVMPCNTAYAFALEIAAAVAIPLVDWPGAVADAMASAGVTRAGILATSGTVLAEIYQRAFGSRDLGAAIPADADQADLMEAIYGEVGVKAVGARNPTAAATLARVAEALTGVGADGLAIACTELSALHAYAPVVSRVPVFDAAHIVARHVVTLAGGDLVAPDSDESSR
jgi:aspartate racemase